MKIKKRILKKAKWFKIEYYPEVDSFGIEIKFPTEEIHYGLGPHEIYRLGKAMTNAAIETNFEAVKSGERRPRDIT